MSSGGRLRCIRAAMTLPASDAGTSTTIPTSSASFSGVALRVRVRTCEYDRRRSANACAVTGKAVRALPMRIHSRAVLASMLATDANQCAGVGEPSRIHSGDSANAAAVLTSWY